MDPNEEWLASLRHKSRAELETILDEEQRALHDIRYGPDYDDKERQKAATENNIRVIEGLLRKLDN